MNLLLCAKRCLCAQYLMNQLADFFIAIDLQQVKLSQKACVTDSHFNFTEDGNGLGTKHLVTVISTGV